MCYGFVLVLFFMFVIHSEARVDTDFENCSEFFFKGKWPKGFEYFWLQHDIKYKYICQNYKNQFFFATLYMTDYRIPLFSAYRLDTFNCIGPQGSRRSKWFIEPQVSYISSGDLMSTEGKPEDWTELQAVNGDYQKTGYDRGHLNPNFYQCNQGRTATFTLTNAVPQNPSFNRIEWYQLEKQAKLIMQTMCNSEGSKRFFVTGVIPSNITIPLPEHDKEGDRKRDYNRVNVPLKMWTAACCYNSKEEKGFSFSYTGSNEQDSHIEMMSIPGLHKFFDKHGFLNARIFYGDCFPLSDDSIMALQKLADATKLVLAKKLALFHIILIVCLLVLLCLVIAILLYCKFNNNRKRKERNRLTTNIEKLSDKKTISKKRRTFLRDGGDDDDTNAKKRCLRDSFDYLAGEKDTPI